MFKINPQIIKIVINKYFKNLKKNIILKFCFFHWYAEIYHIILTKIQKKFHIAKIYYLM